RWLKRNHVVAITVVEPPSLEQQPVLRFESSVQRSAGKRRQGIECRDVEPMRLCEVDRAPEALWRIGIVPEDERRVQAQTMAPEIRECDLVTATHRVAALLG